MPLIIPAAGTLCHAADRIGPAAAICCDDSGPEYDPADYCCTCQVTSPLRSWTVTATVAVDPSDALITQSNTDPGLAGGFFGQVTVTADPTFGSAHCAIADWSLAWLSSVPFVMAALTTGMLMTMTISHRVMDAVNIAQSRPVRFLRWTARASK